MNQLSKKKSYWILQIIGWFSFSLFISILTSYDILLQLNFKALPSLVFNSFILFLLGLSLSHFLRWCIIKFRLLELKSKILFPIFLFISFSLSFIAFSARNTINFLIYDTEIFFFQINELLSFILVFSIIFLLWSLVYFLFHYFESLQEKEIQNITNQIKISEIELQNLKSQLNPHFLFNAMNSIKALINEDPNKAREAVNQLASILRQSLNTNKNQLVTLENEMLLVSNYLQLEKIRFEERLEYAIEMCESCEKINVPPLMIQTLVENAIKHGISKLPKGGKVSIIFKKNDDNLLVKIINPGQLEKSEESGGIGLNNTKERLKLLYSDKASININQFGNEIVTDLIIPIKV